MTPTSRMASHTNSLGRLISISLVMLAIHSHSYSLFVSPQPALFGRLEQLDWVAVGIFKLDLFAAGTGFNLIAESQAGFFQFRNARRQVINFEGKPVPAAALLFAAI